MALAARFTRGGAALLAVAFASSFWLKNVDIVRTYERIVGVVMPVALETTAQVRFAGEATLRMMYIYSAIDGRAIGAPTLPGRSRREGPWAPGPR